jgi:hypothetical protein
VYQENSVMVRPIIAIAASALLSLAVFSTEASARPGGGGFRGGGFAAGGFRGGGFRGGGFRGGFRPGFRGFGPAVGLGLGLGALGYYYYGGYPYYYAGYPYYDDGCVAHRRVWTPYGWRIRWVNVCY